MVYSEMRKKLIANAIKARAARKEKNRLRQQMCTERAIAVQRYHAMRSPLYTLAKVALGL
jgi:hypothetical protein